MNNKKVENLVENALREVSEGMEEAFSVDKTYILKSIKDFEKSNLGNQEPGESEFKKLAEEIVFHAGYKGKATPQQIYNLAEHLALSWDGTQVDVSMDEIYGFLNPVDEALSIPMDKLKTVNPADLAKVAKTTDVVISEEIPESINEGSYDDFLIQYGEKLKIAERQLMYIDLIDSFSPELIDKIKKTLQPYDTNIEDFIFGATHHTKADIARLAFDNQNRWGTELQMVLFAIDDIYNMLKGEGLINKPEGSRPQNEVNDFEKKDNSIGGPNGFDKDDTLDQLSDLDTDLENDEEWEEEVNDLFDQYGVNNFEALYNVDMESALTLVRIGNELVARGSEANQDDTDLDENLEAIYKENSLSEDDEEEENIDQNFEDEYATATTEQKQAIYDLKSWSSELDLDIGQGEETVGDIIKFGFLGGDNGYVSILVSPKGDIKMSGHVVRNFDDYQDLVNFFKTEE